MGTGAPTCTRGLEFTKHAGPRKRRKQTHEHIVVPPISLGLHEARVEHRGETGKHKRETKESRKWQKKISTQCTLQGEKKRKRRKKRVALKRTARVLACACVVRTRARKGEHVGMPFTYRRFPSRHAPPSNETRKKKKKNSHVNKHTRAR